MSGLSTRGTLLRSQQHNNQENVPCSSRAPLGKANSGPVVRQGGRAAFGDLSNSGVLTTRSHSHAAKSKQQPFTIFEDNSCENVPGKGHLQKSKSERLPLREVKEDKKSDVISDFWAEKVAKLPYVPRESLAVRNPSFTEIRHPTEDSPMVLDTSIDEEASSPEWRVPPTSFSQVTEIHEYSLDILRYLKDTETKLLPKWNYMTKQPDINFMMRSILVDWLVEVAEEYKLCTETLYLAVNYIDRFLSYMSVQRAKLQLVGTACMFIAAKYEEIYPPEVHEFTYITDDTYNKRQVLRMEHLVLKVLGFDLTIPSAYFFVNHYAKLVKCSDKAVFLAQYLSELTLLDAERYLCFTPSIIGASALTLARHNCQMPAWPPEMAEYTGYSVEDFQACLVHLHQTFSDAPKCQQQAMREKYRSDKYLRVSEMSPLPLSS